MLLVFMGRQPLWVLGLCIVEVSRSHSDRTRYDTSGRVIGPKHRPIPDNTQQAQGTDIHALGGI